MDPSTALTDIVLPELAHVFWPGEVRAIEICTATHRGDALDPVQDVLELTMTVGPESKTFGAAVWQSVVMARWTTVQMRERLRNDLVDFVAESALRGSKYEG